MEVGKGRGNNIIIFSKSYFYKSRCERRLVFQRKECNLTVPEGEMFPKLNFQSMISKGMKKDLWDSSEKMRLQGSL